MAPFSETRALTSRKYVAEQGMDISKIVSQKYKLLGLHSSISPLESPFFLHFSFRIALKILLFQIFTSKSHWWLLSLKRVHSLPENM